MSMRVRGIPLRRHVYLRLWPIKKRFLRPIHRVSFFADLTRRYKLWTRLAHQVGLDTEVYPEYSKLSARALGESAGVAVPALLDGPIRADQLTLDEYGDRFVVKPNWGTGSRGVVVLERRGPDFYYNLMDDTEVTGDEVLGIVAAGVRKTGMGLIDDLIVEESLAVDGVRPIEWKVFVFYGEVGVIQANRRNATGVASKFFDASWNDVGRVRSDRIIDATIPVPGDPEAVIEAARAISLSVPTGFMRVDLFETPDGPVLGEVCLTPGGDLYYHRGLDRRLGQLWEDANLRILAERRPLIP